MADRHRGFLVVRGAAEGPLLQVDLRLPLGALLCFVGRAGSGSRAMAVDVLCAESRRRYLMALSAFEREALGGVGRVAVDEVSGLPPAMLVDGLVRRRESLASYLQVETGLARLWQEHSRMCCPECGGACRSSTPEEAAAELIAGFAGEPLLVLAPLPAGGDVPISALAAELRRAGFLRLRRGAEVLRLDQEGVDLEAADGPPLEVVVDRLVPSANQRARLSEALRNARAISRGRSRAAGLHSGRQVWLNPQLSCQECGALYGGLGADDFLLGRTERHPLVAQATVEGRRLADLESMSLAEAAAFLCQLRACPGAESLERPLVRAQELGLGYLTLSHDLGDLSTGEQRRLFLASCLTRGLVGILYVFDAPTAGLRMPELHSCVQGLRRLAEQGNTVLVLDHDPSLVQAADRVFTFSAGKVEAGWSRPTEEGTARRERRPNRAGRHLRLRRVASRGLGPLELVIPLERLVAVCGVSGSGKTSLLRGVVAPAMRSGSARGGAGKAEVLVEGGGRISRVVEIAHGDVGRDQPLLAELGLFTCVAEQYSQGPAARVRGYPPGWFLLDQPGGRCPGCEGRGVLHCDMEFLEDICATCPACGGRRYRSEILEVTVRGLSIAELLETSVERACQLFAHEPRMAPRLESARRCGLGRRALGEASSRLERAEYLRLQLAVELARASARDLFILEHPAAGAHPDDVRQLVEVLDELVDRGASVLAEEGTEQFLRQADWLVAMGPGAGPGGGRVVASGIPEQVLDGQTCGAGRLDSPQLEVP